MKHFNKQIHSILYGMHDLLWVVIGLIMLLGVILIASSNSWLYLFVLVPLLIYLYQSKRIGLLKNKNSKIGYQIKRFTKQVCAIFPSVHILIWVVIGLFVLFPVILIASSNSWLYLFLLFPLLVYLYQSKRLDLIKNKNYKVGHQVKRFTKQIQTTFHSMHDLIWVVIGLLLLLGVILIASSNSWLYLFLFVPFLIYLYQTKGLMLMKNKNPKRGKES
jgi:uncharacterized protein (DUF58 family)